MLMPKRDTLTAVAVAAAAVLGAGAPASAQDWSGSGPYGSVARSLDDGTLSVERSGARGGSASATTSCAGGAVVGCERNATVTTPAGATYEGSQTGAVGPFRGRSAATVTGPDGNSVTRFDRDPGWARGPRRFRR